MRLTHIRVENFRALEKLEMDFQSMTVIIGENDVGKTSCMLAVQALFESKKLDSATDFFMGQTSRTVVIEAVFECPHPKASQAEYLAEGHIRIRCSYAFSAARTINVRKSVPKNAALRDLSDKSVEELRTTLADLKLIDGKSRVAKAAAQELLKNHVATLPAPDCEIAWAVVTEAQLAGILPDFVLVPVGRLLDANLKLGESTLLGRLFRPLLKDAVDQLGESGGLRDIRSTLKTCVATRVEELQGLLCEQLNNDTVRLTHQVDLDPMKGLTFDFGMDDERAQGIPIENRGAGVHNNLTLAMFRLLAQYAAENFILAIEEPENSLHPRGQREMLWALQGVAKRAQVICTTHSSVFLDLGHLEHNVVLTRGKAGNTFARKFHAAEPTDLEALRDLLGIRVSDALLSGGGNCALIVEGPTELHAYPHFFQMRGHNARALGVSIIAAGGCALSTIKQHVTVLKVYGIPAVVVLDKDAKSTYDDLVGFGDGGELPNLKGVYCLNEGTFETYIPLDLALEVINEHFPGAEITKADIDLSKDRVKQFEKAIYNKKEPGSRFEFFKVQFGQLIGERMVKAGCTLHAEISTIIDKVRTIAESV